jgi:hypothetical protein
MTIEDMPECCTAMVVGDFWDKKASLIKQLEELIEDKRKYNKHEAVLIATTSSKQHNAIAALKHVGFIPSPPMRSYTYSHSIKLWYFPLRYMRKTK